MGQSKLVLRASLEKSNSFIIQILNTAAEINPQNEVS